MADLMSGSTASFEQLSGTYKGFLTPAVKIKVKGKNLLATEHLLVQQLSVVQAMDEAGSCQFTLMGVYDLKAGRFDQNLMTTMKLGTILEVELGYDSNTKLVFKGYISELSLEMGESPSLSVTAMDVRRLMMDGGARMAMFTAKTYSDIFTEVMRKYQKICTFFVIDKTKADLQGAKVAQTKSDFEFVKNELCVKCDREFFVLAGKAYFRTPQKTKQEITNLSWGNGLISFTRNASYLNTDVRVGGIGQGPDELYEGKAMAKTSEPQELVTSEPQLMFIADPDAVDVSRAQERADVKAEDLIYNSKSGSGSCIGLPELVPGRFLKISKLGNGMDQKYYLKKVEHKLGANGFTTNFQTEGWE